jgi:hypothetical protein
MWKTPIIAVCLLCYSCTLSKAQSFPEPGSSSYKRMNRQGTFALSVGLGVSSYFGDLKGRQADISVKPSTQIGLQYKVSNHVSLRAEVIWYRIAGADSLNDESSSIYSRNLSFRSDNAEWSLVTLYQLFNKYSRSSLPALNPYGFAGIGITTVNPAAFYSGEWHDLRSLMTEGKKYSPVALVIPFGVGVGYSVNNNWEFSAEYGYRYSFSDYLDDVSSFYVGVENMDDPIGKALSDRRPEKGMAAASAGSIRGNEKVNDWYLIFCLKVTFTPPINYRKPAFR